MLVNLTPHVVNILGQEPLAPSGVIARCTEFTVQVGVAGGVPLVVKTFGDVVDLPEEGMGTLYVVSALVRAARPDRHDLASPGDLVRDAAGVITGCKNLVINP